MRERALKFFQYLLMVAGVILLATYGLARIYMSVSSRMALREFEKAQATRLTSDDIGTIRFQGNENVDFSLWSEKRVREYKESLSVENRLPWAVLSIDKLRIRVPVFDGIDELVLNRGVGWISGTAKPGEGGNIGIAGHRDGFFRGLKNIAVGDAVELTTLKEKATYVVDEIEIVSDESVEVLRPRYLPSLTLVTCYPFYFIGKAPQRFIVHASVKRMVETKQIQGSSILR